MRKWKSAADDELFSGSIDSSNSGYLMSCFTDVALVDTYCVGEEKLVSSVSACHSQGFKEVAADFVHGAVRQNCVICLSCTPF